MICAGAIVISGLLSVDAIWSDGAGRRVLPQNRWNWVEVRPNVYVPETEIGVFDRTREEPAICRAFRILDERVRIDPPEPARLWCLEWTADDGTGMRMVCKSP